MEGILEFLEKLKINSGDPITAEHLNKIIDAIIETRKEIIKHHKEHEEKEDSLRSGTLY